MPCLVKLETWEDESSTKSVSSITLFHTRISMAIFLTAHGYGFIKWQFYNENKPTQANT
jgi:hypothetical protein